MTPDNKNSKTRSANKILYSILLTAAVASAIWLPRAFGLERYVATDELPWLIRSGNFYYALSHREPQSTYQNMSPGVVTMWIETFAYLLEFPQFRGYGQDYFHNYKYPKFEEFLDSYEIDPHEILITSRILMVIFNTLVLSVAFLFTRNLFGTLPSLIGFSLIAFDPFHTSITRMAHLDGPLSSLLFLALISFLSYLNAGRKTSHLIISALAGGLAWLTKLPGLIIIPTIVVLLLIDYLFRRISSDNLSDESERISCKKISKQLFVWCAIFFVTLAIFFPAIWVEPINTLKILTLSPISTGRVLPVKMIDGEIVPLHPATPDNGAEDEVLSTLPFLDQPLQYYLRYPQRYVWDTTPVVILGLVAALISYAAQFSIFKERKVRRSVVGLLIFVLLYTFLLTLAEKSSDKYYLPVHPVLDLIAGLGWFAVLYQLIQPVVSTIRKFLFYSALVGLILFQLIPTLRTYPYYSTYFNSMLGGSRAAGQTLVIGSGEGLDQAAHYLNQKPEAENLRVLSWYGIGPFSYFFNGESRSLNTSVWDTDKIEELKESDYLILYNHQWKLKRPVGLMEKLEGTQPEHSVWINEIELARIYDVRQLPPQVFESEISQ